MCAISPMRGINFGPLQYGENKTLSFEIKNEGKYDFNYFIYDFTNEEIKNSIKERRQKELEELGRVEVEVPEVKGGKKPEKKEQKKEKKEEKKGAKKRRKECG